MVVSFKHAVLLAGLWLAFPGFGAVPCDDIYLVVASHEFKVEENRFEAQLNPEGDLVVVLGELVSETWRPREGTTSELPKPYESPRPGSATFTHDGRSLLFLTESNSYWEIHDWKLARGEPSRTDSWHPSNGIPYLVHDRLAVVTMPAGSTYAGDKRNMELWNPMSQSRLRPLEHVSPGKVKEIILSPGRDVLAMRFDSREIRGRLVSVETGKTLFDIPEGWTALEFSPDKKTFVQGHNRTITWRSVADGKVKGSIFARGNGSFRDFVFIDEKSLLSNDGDKLRLWNLEPEKMKSDSVPVASMSMETHGTQIIRTILSPNQKLIATSFSTGEVIVWDRKTWLPLAELVGHEDGVHTIRFSEDSSTVMTADGLGSIRLWDLDPKVKAKDGTRWLTSRERLTITRQPEAGETRIRIDRNLSL